MSEIFHRSAARITNSVAEFLPGLLAFAVVLLFTLAIAWLLRHFIRRALRRFEFDRRLDQLGVQGLADWSPAHSPSQLIAAGVYWFVILMGMLIAVNALDATLTSTLVVRLLNYLQNLFAAALILVVGVLLARFFARSVLISAVNMQVQAARLLSLGVKWLVLVLAGAMALEHIGIGGSIVRLSFGILFGGIVLALALAVGLGSKEMVSRSLQRQVGRAVQEEEESAHLHL